MSNDKTYDRHVNIWINGKEVKNDLSSIKKEMLNLTNQTSRATKGTKEYNEKAQELRRVKQIFKEHKADIDGTGTAWSKVKSVFSSAQGMFFAGLGAVTAAYQSLKTVIFSTDALGDKFEVTLAGWKGGLDAVARAIATMDFKNLGKNIRDAINEGRRYAESLDNIDEKIRALQMQEADAENEIILQRNIQNTSKSLKERIAAGKAIIALEEKLEKIRTGIGKQAYENEATNISNITHLTLAEVEAYARRDEAMIANIEAGKAYNQMVADKKTMEMLSNAAGQRGTSLTQSQINKLVELQDAIAGASEETKRFAFAAENMPGDEKMQLFVDKYVAMRKAMTSATENTLRIQSKLASAEGGLDKKSTVSVEGDTTGLEDTIANAFDPKYNVDDYDAEMQAELDAWVQANILANDQLEKDNEETRAKMAADLIASTEEGLVEITKRHQEERKLLEEKVAAYVSFGARIGEELGAAMADGTLTAKEASKQLILIALDELGNYAQIAITKATIGSLTQADSIATFGASGAIRAAILTGLIKAAVGAAKGIISKNMWDGGYAGSGGKYEPAGIFHKGEYIVNAETVANPAFSPMIQAMEQHRTGYLQGYANGGAPGISASGTGAAGSTPAIVATNPRLENALIQLNRILSNLDSNGVNMKFGYIEADNVRKGIDKINSIEDEVTM